MLNRLPNELLLLIFELLWSPPSYWPRRVHFGAYSLINRRIRGLVFPLRWRSVSFNLSTARDRAKILAIAGAEDKAQLVRSLSLYLDMEKYVTQEDLTERDVCEVVCKFINLEELRAKGLFGPSHIQHDLLFHLPHLRSLRLANLTLHLSGPLTFPNLSELFLSDLILSNQNVSPTQASPLLNAATLPSLHTLAIACSPHRQWPQFLHLPDDLLSQLHGLQIYIPNPADLPANLQTASLLKLVTRLGHYDLALLLARSSFFSPYVLEIRESWQLDALKSVLQVYSIIPPAWPLPLAIFLAASLFYLNDSSTQSHLQSLQAICKTHGVPLICEEERRDGEYGLLTSSQFRTYAKEFKAQQALADQGQE
ncbi:hypothetical protein JCM11251_007906 [Rhodosporidiobolus azoricus]